MTGFDHFSTQVMASCSGKMSWKSFTFPLALMSQFFMVGIIGAMPMMSMPVLKSFPSPAMMATRMASSASMSAKMGMISFHASGPMAFFFSGLFRKTQAMFSFFSTL